MDVERPQVYSCHEPAWICTKLSHGEHHVSLETSLAPALVTWMSLRPTRKAQLQAQQPAICGTCMLSSVLHTEKDIHAWAELKAQRINGSPQHHPWPSSTAPGDLPDRIVFQKRSRVPTAIPKRTPHSLRYYGSVICRIRSPQISARIPNGRQQRMLDQTRDQDMIKRLPEPPRTRHVDTWTTPTTLTCTPPFKLSIHSQLVVNLIIYSTIS